MTNDLTITKQNAKLALAKSKKLIDLTNKILYDKDENCPRLKYFLPNTLSRMQQLASDSKQPVIILVNNSISHKSVLTIFIKRLHNPFKQSLLIIDTQFLWFLLKEKFEESNQIICTIEESSQYDLSSYDEVLLFGNYTLDVLLVFKEKTKNLSFTTNDAENTRYFPSNLVYEDDESYLPVYEIFDFAKQFLPHNSEYNNQYLVDKCQQINSGADKPYQFEVDSFEEELDILFQIFDENPIDNIVIYLPYGNSIKEYDLSVDKYHKLISKRYKCTRYYSGVVLQKLCSIVITTFDAIKYFDFDIVIVPQLYKASDVLSGNTLFEAMCSSRNQLFTIVRKRNG